MYFEVDINHYVNQLHFESRYLSICTCENHSQALNSEWAVYFLMAEIKSIIHGCLVKKKKDSY